MAVAEQQQNLVNQAVKELQITEERIQKVISRSNPSYRIKIAKYGLTGGTAGELIVKTAKKHLDA